MKFTIEGFSQQRAIELGLSVEDLVILRWFVDFWPSEKMTKMQHDGKMYALVNYSGFIEQMPIIGCNKRTIARKFQRLVEADVLENITIKQGGSFSVYRFGGNYESLVFENVHGCTRNDNGVVQETTTGLYKNVHTNTNLLNTNLINTNTPYNPPEGNECKDDFKKLLEQTMGFTPKQSKEESEPELTKLTFDDFWSAYPKKKSKGQALTTWDKLKPNQQTIKKMITAIGVMKTKASWTKDNGQFIPYPSSWLNDMGWEDEEAQPPKTYSYEFTRIGGDSVEENALRNQVKVKVKENE